MSTSGSKDGVGGGDLISASSGGGVDLDSVAKIEVREGVARSHSRWSQQKAAVGPTTGCRLSNTWRKVGSGGFKLRLHLQISSHNDCKT